MEHSCGEAEEVTTFHLRPQDWIQHFMDTTPGLLGGYTGDPYKNFEAFWTTYQVTNGNHQVYEDHRGHLNRVVPLLIHGDEGRAVKRTNYFLTSVETPFGPVEDPSLSCSCGQMLERRQRAGLQLPTYGNDSGSIDAETLGVARKLITNYKGHSYLSKWLLFGVGGWVYKKYPQVITALLNEVAANMKELYETGVTLSNGSVVYGALVAIKGDLDFHKKTANLTRCYANVGSINAIQMCHLCLAGSVQHDFEDYSESPEWASSSFASRPWDIAPYLTQIPHYPSSPEKIIENDLMHVFKLGVGRDIVGGILVILLRKGFFDSEGQSKDIRYRFERSYSHFHLWCKATGKTAGLRSFSKAYFNMTSLMSAPWSNSKASDTMLLLEWLAFVLRTNLDVPTVHGFENLLKPMLQLCECGLALRMVHRHPLFLERQCALYFYINAMTVLRAYSYLGQKAIEINIRAFVQKPKCHALHHIAHKVKMHLLTGASVIPSPQIYSCDMNEDWIGRVARLSRRVGFRMVDKHVIERYFLKITSLLKQREHGITRKTILKSRRRLRQR